MEGRTWAKVILNNDYFLSFGIQQWSASEWMFADSALPEWIPIATKTVISDSFETRLR